MKSGIRIQVDDPEATIRDGLVPVEIIDHTLTSVVEAPMTLGKPMEFELPPGSYAIRAYLPSGRTVHQQCNVNDDGVTQVDIPSDASSFIESIAQSWSVLEGRSAFRNREMFAELRKDLGSLPLVRNIARLLSREDRSPLAKVWARLWEKRDNQWEARTWAPAETDEEGTGDLLKITAVFNLPEGQHYLQIGGSSQNWKCFALPADEALRVSFGVDKTRQENDRVVVSVRRSNSAAESLLDLLARGSLQQARVVNQAVDARELLFRKKRDPLSATVAAYYLLRAGDLEGVSDWAANLADWFEWLPDGAVIHGWYFLQTSQPDKAIDRFLLAWQRGLPVYAEGLRLLFDGLRMFETEHEQRGDDVRGATEALRPFVLSADLAMQTTSFAGLNPTTPTISPVRGAGKAASNDGELVYVSSVDTD